MYDGIVVTSTWSARAGPRCRGGNELPPNRNDQGIVLVLRSCYGDVQPVPLASGGVLFVRYAYAGDTVGSQLMLIRQPKATPVPLTAPEDHCGQPALSASGNRVAMVCSYGGQNTSVEVAALDGAAMGPRQVLVSGVQAAQPTWSPDGGQVVYLAPAGLAGHFQLWSATAPAALPTPVPAAPGRSRTPGPSAQAPQPAAPGPASATPVQLTDNLDFDATSTIAWAG